jgi:hypothetical protein
MDWQQRDALFEKLKAKNGYKGKVQAKCFDCTYDPEGVGNWRQQVDACGVTTCALYEVRPRSSSSVDQPEQSA